MSATIEFDHETTGEIEPIDDHVIVYNIETVGDRIQRGIILLNEDTTDRGVRPRWAQIYKVGPNQTDVEPGEWILIEHGRWTRGIRLNDGKTYRKVDPDSILVVTKEEPVL